MNTRNMLSALLAVIMLAFVMPNAAMAAPVEITASIKSSLDKTMTSTDHARANSINSLYGELLRLQNQEEDLDDKIKAIHTDNSKTSSALSKQIREIDKPKLDELKAQVTQTKEQYKPLFSEYTELNKQIKLARSIKDKDLTSLLRLQADLLKMPIQLARADVKIKEEALKAAKSSASAAMKEIRGTVTGTDPVKGQIKAKQGEIKTIETSVTPVWNTFKAAVKKADSATVVNSLESLVSYSRQINQGKQEILHLETKISEIHAAAKKQLP